MRRVEWCSGLFATEVAVAGVRQGSSEEFGAIGSVAHSLAKCAVVAIVQLAWFVVARNFVRILIIQESRMESAIKPLRAIADDQVVELLGVRERQLAAPLDLQHEGVRAPAG